MARGLLAAKGLIGCSEWQRLNYQPWLRMGFNCPNLTYRIGERVVLTIGHLDHPHMDNLFLTGSRLASVAAALRERTMPVAVTLKKTLIEELYLAPELLKCTLRIPMHKY